MNSKKLSNGFEIASIGYGTYPQKDSLKDNIPLAISMGYQLIDTSDNYNNEYYVGIGLEKEPDVSNFKIISKFSQPNRTYELEFCFEESEEKIGRRVSIYLLHWPYPFLWKKQWRRMERLYQEGRCDAIGVCNFEKKHLVKMLQFCKINPMINQIELHPFFQQRETTLFCEENDIQVMAYSPLARMDKTVVDNEVLSKLAKKYNKSISQIIFRWDIQHGYVPIPASKKEKHMRENINVFDFELTLEEMRAIDSLDSGMRTRFDPDKRFSFKEKLYFLLNRIKHVGR
jgi:diketogulonate reductase-like aldo/keto reductase